MKILVIGPGALGIVTAVGLHRAGHDVTVAVRTADQAERLQASGFTAISPDGTEHRANIPCVHALAGTYDLMIHTTKHAASQTVMSAWLPHLSPDGWVVPFQNGVEGDRMQAIVGDRFMECSVYWPATRTDEGVSVHRGEGPFVIGPWPDGPMTADHERIADVLRAVAPTQTSDAMLGVKWSKLAINAAMTSCGVISGKTLGEMVRHRPSADAFLGVLRETVAVMAAADIPVVRIGPSKPDLLAKLPRPIARLALRLIARRYNDARSSSAQSLARGEKTEVDILNGRIVAEGKRFGVPTPVNAAVVDAVHAIERGELEQGLDAVDAMMGRIEDG